MAAGACNDTTPHFFPNVAANTTLSWAVTGPAGQFTATVKLKKNTDPSQSKPDSGNENLTPGVYALTIVVLLFDQSEVKVEVGCGTHKFCRTVSGPSGTAETVSTSVVAA